MLKRTDTASRMIHAAPTAIYQAFASADAMQAWLPPQGMTAQMLSFDFRDGGGYRMCLRYDAPQHPPGKTSADSDDVTVRFVRLVPGTRIEQAVVFDSEDPAFSGTMRIIWTFEAADNASRVTVRCEDVPTGISAADHQAGLQSTLRTLAAFVEAPA